MVVEPTFAYCIHYPLIIVMLEQYFRRLHQPIKTTPLSEILNHGKLIILL